MTRKTRKKRKPFATVQSIDELGAFGAAHDLAFTIAEPNGKGGFDILGGEPWANFDQCERDAQHTVPEVQEDKYASREEVRATFDAKPPQPLYTRLMGCDVVALRGIAEAILYTARESGPDNVQAFWVGLLEHWLARACCNTLISVRHDLAPRGCEETAQIMYNYLILGGHYFKSSPIPRRCAECLQGALKGASPGARAIFYRNQRLAAAHYEVGNA